MSNSFFDTIVNKHVLIIGDVMIDQYVHGNVNRISPEAPVPVLEWKSDENRLGGAANVALNIRAMGAVPILCSMIGDDSNGAIFFDLLVKEGIPADGILVTTNRPTTMKTRFMAGKQQLLRLDQETTQYLTDSQAQNLVNHVARLLEKYPISVIIFQDYNKGVLPPLVISSVIEQARQRGIPTAVDPKATHFWEYKGVTLFKPNLKEISSQLPFSVQPDEKSLGEAARHIHQQLGNPYVMITLSEKAVFVADAEADASWLLPTRPRAIADVCGAGDTVISVAALALAANFPLSQIGYLANLAGGQVCERVGVIPVDRNQLLREYEEYLQTIQA